MLFKFDVSGRGWRLYEDVIYKIKAPNLNVALLKLALQEDLEDVSAVYIITTLNDEEDNEE